eukprot:TRINITY_DN50310_c0_g1_i1.p1 TRINITY_DN50310_c0_g1~~TRINITY_DN50310_c0_g1_i1.p1  ORF type:complete len:384 (-),score=84.48 TRINITY_DN50310_c0_g1_i1:84-1235(-)
MPAASVSATVPTMRTLGQVCQPVSALPSVVRVAGPWLSAFPVPHQALQLQTQFREPCALNWKSELCCSALRNYPMLAALLDTQQKPVNDAASEREVFASQPNVADSTGEIAEAFARNASSPSFSSEQPKSTIPSSSALSRSSEDPPQPEESKGKKSDVSQDTHSTPALAAAHMIMRDYETRLQRLERQCRELNGENYRLQAELFVSQKSQESSRELNLLLTRKVKEARHQCSEAAAQVEALTQELDHLRENCSRRGHDCESKHSASPQFESLQIMPPPGLAGLTSETPSVVGCCGDAMSAWGCEEHQVYTQRLMLAHQALSLSVAAGPPGLEPVEQDAGVGFRTQHAEDLTFKLRSKACPRRGHAPAQQRPRKMKVLRKRQQA